MLCDWGTGYRVCVSVSVDSCVVSMRGEYVIGDTKGYDDDVEAILGVNE